VRTRQFFLHALAVGHVAHDHGVVGRVAAGARDRAFQRKTVAVGAQAGDGVVGGAASGAAAAGAEEIGGAVGHLARGFMRWLYVALELTAEHLLDAGAEQHGGGRVGGDDGIGEVRRDDGFAGVMDDLAAGRHGVWLLRGAPSQCAAGSQAEQKGCWPAGEPQAARSVHRYAHGKRPARGSGIYLTCHRWRPA
jgi:hypothetical protein